MASSLGETFQLVWKHRKSFASLVVTLTLIIFLSRGTQDLYPDFLQVGVQGTWG